MKNKKGGVTKINLRRLLETEMYSIGRIKIQSVLGRELGIYCIISVMSASFMNDIVYST